MNNKKNEEKKNKEKESDKNQIEENNSEETEKLRREKQEFLNGWKRARADFINYKKNEQARLAKAKKREKVKIMRDVLDILDSFDLAEKNIRKSKKEDNYLSGLISIKKQFKKFLHTHGVEELKTEGKEFDPNLHEAVAMVDSDKIESGKIVEEVNKGYLLDGELLRPAKVKVAK